MPDQGSGKKNGQKDSSFSHRVQGQIERGNYVRPLMEKSFMNRYQIAKISGLAHSHIKGLEDGVIENPKRASIVPLGVALNLGLKEIDDLLEFFGQPKLTQKDARLFIELAEKRELTKTLQPLYGQNISLDLLLISMEKIEGELVVFNDKLPLALRPTGHPSFLYGFTDNPVYSHIVEELHKTRVTTLMTNLANSNYSHYITKSLLTKYIKLSSNTKFRDYMIDHILNLIDILDHDNFNFNILKSGPLFRFAIKYPVIDKISKKLFFVGHALYENEDQGEYRESWLRGYATDDENLVKQFDQEYKKFLLLVDEKVSDKESIKEFMLKLLFKQGNVSEKELNRKLEGREKFPYNILR
jgi:hypothetical protein